MKQIYKVVLLLSVILMASASFAGNKKQTFTLHVNSTPGYPSYYICLETSDVFGYNYCGDGAEVRYAMGPKNWGLYINDPNPFIYYYYEASCYNYFMHIDGNYPKRSPKKKGKLDIYVSVEYNKIGPSLRLYDCHANWTPES